VKLHHASGQQYAGAVWMAQKALTKALDEFSQLK